MLRIILTLTLLALAGCSKPAEQAESQPRSAPGADVNAASEAATPAPTAAPIAAAARTSRYTALKACKLVEINENEDWSVSRCAGPGGQTVMLNYGDAREDIELRPAGAKPVALGLPQLAGGGFNTLGDTIEWRGTGEGAGFAPTSLIIRNAAVQDPDQPERPTALLVVIDLAQRCVVAQVKPQAGQNEAARAIADGPRQPCVTVS